jgi:hypothetical protein
LAPFFIGINTMKIKSSPLSSRLTLTLGSLFLTLPLLAEKPKVDLQNEAYRTSVSQETLRRDALTAKEELAAIREEMKEFLPDDLALIDRAFNKLQDLSKGELQAVVNSLRTASKTSDIRLQLETLVGAQKTQTQVINSLNRLSTDLNARQSASQITSQFQRLLLAQSSISTNTNRLMVATPEVLPSKLKGDTLKRHQAILGEQQSLTPEIVVALENLKQLNNSITEGPARDSVQKALKIATEGNLQTSSEKLASSFSDNPLPSSHATQVTLVKALSEIVDTLKIGEVGLSGRVAQLASELKLLREQQANLADPKAIATIPDAFGEIRKKQREISEAASALIPQIQGLNAQSAEKVKASTKEMEAALTILAKNKETRTTAATPIQSAHQLLLAAEAELNKQLAQMEKNEGKPLAGDLNGALSKLQSEIAQAAQAQNKLNASANASPASPANAAAKEALQAKVQALQQEALGLVPDTAKKLGEAMAQMSDASQASQEAAAASLADASEQLKNQIAALNGQSAEQQALAAAASKIEEAMKTAAAAQSNLNSSSPKTGEAFAQLDAASKQAAAAAAAAAAAEKQASASSATPPAAASPSASASAATPPSAASPSASASAATPPSAASPSASASAATPPSAASPSASASAAPPSSAASPSASAAAAMQQAQAALSAASMSAAQAKASQASSQAAAAQAAMSQAQAALAQASQAMAAEAAAGLSSAAQSQMAQSSSSGTTAGTPKKSSSSESNQDSKNGDSSFDTDVITVAAGRDVQIVGRLSPKDRDGVTQLQAEKPPSEFAGEVQQYYKNLATGAGL